MEEIYCDGYDLELVPSKATDDKKTGVTIKGSQSGYLEAHKLLKEMFKKKGDRFLINGTEIGISDTPKNKPIIIEVKAKGGLTGKVNLTIFDVNNRGGATIMVQKIKGGDPIHVKILGIEVIKYLLDGLIEGKIEEDDIGKFKLKNQRTIETKRIINCEKCEKAFPTEQGLRLHMTRIHRGEEKFCDLCRITLKTETDFKGHMELEHREILSPKPKKRRRDSAQEDVIVDLNVTIAEENVGNLKHFEKNSWEEMRLKHREIETQVNEEELSNMNEYGVEKRNMKVKTKIDDIEANNDKKVLEKQRSWFVEEVKYQEMKRKLTEDRIKEENRKKRQISIGKKKKSKSKREKEIQNDLDIMTNIDHDHDVSEVSETEESGPGYMGWTSEENDKNTIKNAFDELRKEVQELKSGEIKNTKLINSLEKDVKSLKEEYKLCLEALSKETYEKNKAEELSKILIETLEVQKKQKLVEKERTENSEDEMSVEEGDFQSWRKQKSFRKTKQNRETNGQSAYFCVICKLRYKTKSELEKHIKSCHGAKAMNKCEECNVVFTEKEELEKHMKSHHKNEINYECNECQLIYKTNSELDNHIRSLHVGREETKEVEELRFSCQTCDQGFKEEEQLKHHSINVHADKVFTCQKCDKPYISMTLLRRHDWRSHREIECNLCGETIKCRQEIKSHRQTKHQMFKKVFCKYFPECLDGDECFFEHEKDNSVTEHNASSYCPNGEKCSDQSCKYTEKRHISSVLCKFQASCNRLNCQFKHSVARKAFLEEELKQHLKE